MSSPLDFNRYCRRCLHSLRGVVSRRCPECGAAFDPHDSRTTNAHPWPGFWAALAKLARQLTILMTGFAGFAIGYSALGFHPLWLFLPAFAAVHIVLFMLFALAAPAIPLTWRWRVTGFAAIAVIVSVLFTHWPLRLTFVMHRPWLESIAQQVQAEGTIDSPKCIGAFRFQRIIRNDRGSIGFKLNGSPGNGVHFVWSPTDSSHGWYNSATLARLGPHWYLIDED